MKQKRKVKSLLPQKKDWRSSFLTAVLLILSVALCIGSASLITSRVWAAEFKGFQYTGLDDKQEVLYGMRFVNKNDMQKLVSEIYVNGKSLYIVPNPVVVNEVPGGTEGIFDSSNSVNLGVYGHVLGGRGNKVESDNVTLIAGTHNTVRTGNDNAAFLGGDSNKQIGTSNGTPVVVVGGQGNKVGDDHDGVALIGGKSNEVGESVSNAFLLGGRENEVGESRKNVIVGGQNVEVNSTDNVFVYSNKSSFVPKSSNAFYLNMGGGVGINTGASDKGLAVKGPVSLGEIDIIKETCDPDNLGVEGSYQGCVVGCTKASMEAEDRSKWEMLDRGQKCLDICADPMNKDFCAYEKDEEIPPKPDYKAFCTEGVDLSNAELCFPDELSGYQNVIFETSLVDNGNCDMAKGENKCVYQCKSGYHLAKDKTQASNLGGDRGKIKCFKDCDLESLLGSEWSDYVGQAGTGKMRHGETVIAYNKLEVPLSYHRYGKLEGNGYTINDYLDDGFGTKAYRHKGIGFDNLSSYTLPEHCENNAHMQKLVCASGALYILKENSAVEAGSKLATVGGTTGDRYLGYAHDGYIHRTCETKEYRCDTGVNAYEYTRAQILAPFDSGLNDNEQGKTRTRKDRNLVDLTRGQYKLCLDYDVVPGKNNTGKVVNTGNPYNYHYKWVKCQSGYTEYPKDSGSHKCMQKCTVTPVDRTKSQSWEHSSVVEFYLSGSETCTGVCKSQWFVCNDGTFYQSGYVGDSDKTREKLNYKYSECTLHDNMCNTDEYNVKASVYEQWKDYGTYISCDDYANNFSNFKNTKYHPKTNSGTYNKECKKYDTHYKLVGCKPGYHTENNLWCIENVRDLSCGRLSSHAKWDRKTGPLEEYPWDEQIGKYKTELKEGRYLRRWEESCGWSGSANLCETDELQDGNEGEVIPGGACDYTCDIGWFDIGDYDCREIQTTCAYPNNDPYACTNEEPYACSDPEAHTGDARELDEGWKWTCSNGLRSQSCLVCKDGYHKENDECVPNVQGVCNNNVRYGCSKGRSDVEGADKHEETDKFTWYCLGIDGGNGSTNEGYDCSDIGKSNSCYICKEGYHKTSTYGECEEDSAILSYDAKGLGIAPADEVMWYTTSTYAAYMDDVPGFQFKEWCEQRDGGGKCYDEGELVKGAYEIPKTKTLYAQWIEDSATLTYYSNGHGSPYSWDVAMKYTDEVRAADAMEAEKYNSLKWHNFVEWCTYSNGGGDCYPVGRVVKNKNVEPSDMELYAQWASCKGGFLNAHPVVGIGNSTLDITSTLWDTETEAGSTNCSFVCDPGYEPNDDTTACEAASYSCGYEPKQCLGKNGTVEVKGWISNHKWTRTCPNASAPCNECETGYEPDSDGNCVLPGACCLVVPEHATEIFKEEGVRYTFKENEAPLCKSILYIEEEVADDTLYTNYYDENGCWYEGPYGEMMTSACGAVKHCCFGREDILINGHWATQINCENIPRSNCTSPSGNINTKLTVKEAIGFKCDAKYTLNGCDCVLDSPETPMCGDVPYTCKFAQPEIVDQSQGIWKCGFVSCSCDDYVTPTTINKFVCPRGYDLSSSDNKCHLNYRFCAVPANCTELSCTARSDVRIESCFGNKMYARNPYASPIDLLPRIGGERWTDNWAGSQYLSAGGDSYIVSPYMSSDPSCNKGLAEKNTPLVYCGDDLIKYNDNHSDIGYSLTSCRNDTDMEVITPCLVKEELTGPKLCPEPQICSSNSCQYYNSKAGCVRTCFVAGTKVTMSDGSQKNIEDVKVGEKLLSDSGTNTVLGYYRPKLGNRHLRSINGGEYFVSDEHPFMTTEGWKSFDPEMTKQEVDLDVTKLKVGDVLITVDGYEVIKTLDFIDSDEDTQLYNFVLDGDHTYYADGYLVHNKQHYYQTETASEPENNSCRKGSKWASKGDRGCCPDNGNEYYLEGSSCYLLCPYDTPVGGNTSNGGVSCKLNIEDTDCVREFGNIYDGTIYPDKPSCDSQTDYYVCKQGGSSTYLYCHKGDSSSQRNCLSWR